MLSILTDPLLSLLYPQKCGSCGGLVEKAVDGAACRDCWEDTKIFDGSDPLCVKCGLYLSGQHFSSESTCKQCDDDCYDKAVSAGIYERALAASVIHLKSTPTVSLTAANCLLHAFENLDESGEIRIVPVPLSKARLAERGFNQASLLARVVSKHTGCYLDEHSLVREKDTPMHRAAMDKKAREATVKNVFTVTRPNLIKGGNLLLVDDLMTSGSTASQCAKILKKSGAAKVIVLTLARAA